MQAPHILPFLIASLSAPLLMSGSALAQAALDDPSDPNAPPARSANAEALRSRINTMRMNLLLGGDRVRQAEREAVDFYSGKAGLVDRLLDEGDADLSEKRAAYNVVLDRALTAKDAPGRRKAMGEAAKLRGQITELEDEEATLEAKRKNLSQLVTAVEARERDRERLVAQLETSDTFQHELGLPFTSIGLAPAVEIEAAASSPLDDPKLVEDLIRRDPVNARRTLFDMDPVHYWDIFPLKPPAAILEKALAFPLPDLPGKR